LFVEAGREQEGKRKEIKILLIVLEIKLKMLLKKLKDFDI
jgi:hypothetical protein